LHPILPKIGKPVKSSENMGLSQTLPGIRGGYLQVMNLQQLAPDIQEEVLFLPLVTEGLDPIRERDVRPIAAVIDWRKQRRLWRNLLAKSLQPELKPM
jgi:hypothetical protein